MPATDPIVEPRPLVSILIAARNEEAHILDCLRAISRLDFPQQQFDVLIGDDASTDRTSSLVAGFIADKPDFRLFSIQEGVAGLRGKANVLAQLARHARGRYLFFTDADTRVPVSWLTEMSRQFAGNVGVVTGVTLPDGPGLFTRLQTIDWLYNLTLAHLLSSAGIPVTAMGNNMAVRRDAYDAVGGYEALPFSVTEDYALFRAVVGRGFGFRNLLNENVLARTRPAATSYQFLHQRKRWMRGATTRGASALPVWIIGLLYAQYLLGPLLLLLGTFAPGLAVGLYLVHLLVQTSVLAFGLGRLRLGRWWPYAVLFEPYQLLIGPLAVLFYWLPTGIDWKGRQYR